VIERLIARAVEEQQTASESAPAVLDLLALSGGGDYGAFGAGFLVGWGEAADPAWRRPEFDGVSGVSTGAMLAPFAYVGTDRACRTVENFYRNPKADWVQDRGPFFFFPSNPSFMVIQNLERDLRDAIDGRLVDQMAQQSRKGKVLMISATDLDFGRQKCWDVGAEAEVASASGNRDRLARILMASSAIPVAFPPVDIDGHLYADGGVTANVFLRLDPRSPDGFLQRWIKVHPGRPLPRVRYWIIINNQLAQPPQTVQSRWPAIVSPSLATAIRSATVSEIRWLAAQADYVNAAWNADIEVRVVAIPDDWRPPVAGDFKRETMVSLSDLGRKMGADPKSWRVWAAPDRAALRPFPGADPVPALQPVRSDAPAATPKANE
jgi:hypothetical protein